MSFRRSAPYLLVLGLLGCGNNTDAPPASYGALLVTLGEQVILPEHREFVTQADGLVGALEALEQSPAMDTLASAQAAWRAARKAYRMLDAVQLVPDVNPAHHPSASTSRQRMVWASRNWRAERPRSTTRP